MLKTSCAAAMTLMCAVSASAVNFIADPDPAAMVSELSAVTLTFPDASVVDMGSQYRNVTVTAPDFNRSCTLDFGAEDNQIVVSFSKISEEGTYTLNVPADAITADDEPLEAFSITYRVGVERIDRATLIPAPGEVEWLYDFIFTDPDVPGNLSVDTYSGPKATVTSPSGEVSDITPVYDYMIGNGRYRLCLRRLATEPGVYTISFPEGYFYYYDQDYSKAYLPAYEFTYEVTGGQLTEVVSDPSMTKPTFNFNFLSLEFPGYDAVALKPDMSYAESSVPVYLEGKDDSYMVSLMLTNFVVDGNNASYTNQYTDCTTPGHYFLTIPAGAFHLGEHEAPCTPFTVDFEVVAPQPAVIDITPADGTTVSMLRSAVVTFPEISFVDLARSPSMSLYRVTGEGDDERLISVGGAYSSVAFARLSDNSFIAEFNGLATVDGDYRIVLNANSFVYEGGYNQEYTVEVKFTAPETPEFTMTPDNAEALPKIQKFTISFPDVDVVTVNTLLSNKTATLYKGEEIERSEWGYILNQTVGSTSDYTPVEGSSNSFSFTLSSAGLDKGKYLLSIPAGVFLTGEDMDNFSGEVTMVYECNGEGIDKVVATPSEPVRELSEMAITFIDETSVSLQSEYAGFTLYKEVEGQSYGTYIEYISGANVKVEGNTLFLTPTVPIVEEGVYYVEISAYSLFMSDGVTASTPQKVYFTVDPNAVQVSVSSVASEASGSRIFTVMGVEVKDMTAPGIYVVGGRKVIVR